MYRKWTVLMVSVIVAISGLLLICGHTLTRGGPAVGDDRVYDLDQDGVPERYVLNDQQLIIAGEKEIWRSPPEWEVTGFKLADATNDGQGDLLLVLWKSGSFGQHKPFWFKGEDDQYSNHLFVYNLAKGKLHPVWCSSALDQPIIELSVADVDQDGRNELVVLGEEGALTTWRWRDWGFHQVESGNNNLR
ncbi:MAG: hypothetical protein HPY50_18980 [Firmicutes bacterium]|nr:hypothetical protein [Bacillota bacterium]